MLRYVPGSGCLRLAIIIQTSAHVCRAKTLGRLLKVQRDLHEFAVSSNFFHQKQRY
jgi:hypothetical protein